MNDNDTITIPRTLVEQALEALTNCTIEYGHRCNRCDSEVDPDGNVASALRAALEQPPTTEQSSAVEQPRGGQEPDWQDMYQKEKRRAEMWTAKYEQDIGKLEVAVPVVGQPQVEQEPVAWALSHSKGLEFSSAYPMQKSKQAAEQMAIKHMGAVTVSPLYTHPQPKREPLCEYEGCPHHGTAHVYIN